MAKTNYQLDVQECVSMKEKLINRMIELKNYQSDRFGMYYEEEGKCNVLRLENYKDEFYITIVYQEYNKEDDEWEDGVWNDIVKGNIENINDLITDELYNNIISEMQIIK